MQREWAADNFAGRFATGIYDQRSGIVRGSVERNQVAGTVDVKAARTRVPVAASCHAGSLAFCEIGQGWKELRVVCGCPAVAVLVHRYADHLVDSGIGEVQTASTLYRADRDAAGLAAVVEHIGDDDFVFEGVVACRIDRLPE